MTPTLIFISIATFLSTMIGGLFALYLKDRLHLILGFSAGAILGVAFFDLIPEALEMTSGIFEVTEVLSIVVIGFAAYLLLDRTFAGHSHGEENTNKGNFGAGSISTHSFLDGMGVGLAFHVSATVGAIVAIAVLVHNFSDGINTVGYILRNGGERVKALKWLTVDAMAPVLGILSTLFFSVPEDKLGLLLALFSGFFLYIGASDLIPESYHNHPVKLTTFMTIFGMIVIYIIVKVAGV